jgi:hypothetical protein
MSRYEKLHEAKYCQAETYIDDSELFAFFFSDVLVESERSKKKKNK